MKRALLLATALAFLSSSTVAEARPAAKVRQKVATTKKAPRKARVRPSSQKSQAKQTRLRHLRKQQQSQQLRKTVARGKQARQLSKSKRGIGKGLVFRGKNGHRDVDLVIFDLDGTLASTAQDIATNFKAGFKHIGVDVPMSKLLALVDGSPLKQTYWEIRPNGNDKELQRFLDGFMQSQAKRGPQGTPYEGIPELLKSLSKQPGVKLAVATARPPDNAALLLKRMGLRDHFSLVAGTHGSGMPHKPAPDMLLYVASRLGVTPKRTVFIGDTYTDVKAGKAAGMATVALTYGMGQARRLKAHKPDFVASRVERLFKLLSVDRASGEILQTARQHPPRVRINTQRHAVEAPAGM